MEKTGSANPAEYWDFDVRTTYFRPPGKQANFKPYFQETLPEGTYFDEWGIANVPGSMFHFTRMIGPLREVNTVEEIENFPLPDYESIESWRDIETDVTGYHRHGYAVIGGLEMTIFEVSWYLRGMENLMSDLILTPSLAVVLLDRITNLRKFQARKFAEFDVDILALGDDIAMQTGMLMSPKMWRKWFKPRLAEVIEIAKETKPELLVQYHTDGDCREVIPDLIEVGVDILNPVQPECMDPVALKKQYGDVLSFSGTIGTQSTMPHGRPQDVLAEVKRMIQTVGEGGGLFLAPTHVLEPDVPWENVLAFVDGAKMYGGYF
jgi:uroporphyrinogen decarboxylase